MARVLRAALALAVVPRNHRGRRRLSHLLGLDDDPETAERAIGDLLASENVTDLIERVRVCLGLSEDSEDVIHARQVLMLAQREWGGEPPSAIGRRVALEWHRLSVQLQQRERSVRLMTTFAAKGLEFRTVILPGFGLGQIPYSPPWRGRFTSDELAEERRKLYVAITRSSDRLFFTYRTPNPSAFLGEVGSTLVTDGE